MFLERALDFRAGIVCAAALLAAVVAAPPASAATKVAIQTAVANPSEVGVTHDGTITITNQSSGLDQGGIITLLTSSIQLTPSCSTITFPCAAGDPFVFSPFSPAHGRAGTACAGTNYFVIGVDPSTGRFVFSNSKTDVLTPPGTPLDTCVIDFTYTTLKAPRVDVDAAPGIQTYVLSEVDIQNSLNGNGGETFNNFGNALVTVPSPVPPPAEPPKKKCKKKKSDNKNASAAKKKKKKCKKKGKKD